MNSKQGVKNGIIFSYKTFPELAHSHELSHAHGQYELFFLALGDGVLEVDGREYSLRARTLAIIPTDREHRILFLSQSYECLFVHFSETDLTDSTSGLLSDILSSGALCLQRELAAPTVTSALSRLCACASLQSPERETYLSLLLSELVLLLSVSDKKPSEEEDKELGARVLAYVDENIDKDVSLDALAKIFFVSKYYLCRAFKRYSGTSVHSYVNRKRVLYAKQLIEGGETASGAAYRVGFGDYSAFYRAYVKILGVSPTSKKSERSEI